MTNSITFKYNGKIWNPKDPEKKLKQLGITWDDVEIIEEIVKQEQHIEYQDTQLYYFINHKTGESITSIYSELKDLPININDYERTTKEFLESRRN